MTEALSALQITEICLMPPPLNHLDPVPRSPIIPFRTRHSASWKPKLPFGTRHLAARPTKLDKYRLCKENSFSILPVPAIPAPQPRLLRPMKNPPVQTLRAGSPHMEPMTTTPTSTTPTAEEPSCPHIAWESPVCPHVVPRALFPRQPSSPPPSFTRSRPSFLPRQPAALLLFHLALFPFHCLCAPELGGLFRHACSGMRP